MSVFWWNSHITLVSLAYVRNDSRRIAELKSWVGGWLSQQINFQSVFSSRNRVQNWKVSVCPGSPKYGLFISWQIWDRFYLFSYLDLIIHQYFRANSSPQIVWDMYTGITFRKCRCSHFSCIGSGNECFLVEQPYNTHFPCVCTK